MSRPCPRFAVVACCAVLCCVVCGLGTALASQHSRPEHVTAPEAEPLKDCMSLFCRRKIASSWPVCLYVRVLCVCVRVSLLTTGEHSSKSMTSPAGGITVQLSEWGAGVQMTRENERPPVCTSSADWTDPYARFRPACGIRQQRQVKGRQDRARLARLFPSRTRESSIA